MSITTSHPDRFLNPATACWLQYWWNQFCTKSLSI